MRKFLAALAMLALAGCGQTAFGDDITAAVKDRGKTAAATTLENTLWTLCRAIPIGAVRDRFLIGETRWKAYMAICEIPNASELPMVKPAQ